MSFPKKMWIKKAAKNKPLSFAPPPSTHWGEVKVKALLGSF